LNCRGDDEAPSLNLGQALYQWNTLRECLAGPSLRDRDKILALDSYGYGLPLDWCWFGELEAVDGIEQTGCNAQASESAAGRLGCSVSQPVVALRSGVSW